MQVDTKQDQDARIKATLELLDSLVNCSEEEAQEQRETGEYLQRVLEGRQAPDAWLVERLDQEKWLLDDLLAVPEVPFDERLHGRLPQSPGIYVIKIRGTKPGQYLRAGRTKRAGEGLLQRVYRNHLHGHQSGNLRSQLVRSGWCESLDAAKKWMRENCTVQFLVIQDERERRWAEYFMLSILRPEFCD